ncbi:AraC family transcriptional regulator ligand-binding domain-containing protein [Aliamphritea hakodatensis]|uniref:AraC family transcriptional regulator ligand-binding domain-containing protein n=1 Tax=Aliamphritea hakodatensis TaxID=2895352 RepID=UPI0022FD91D0|nr:AraC family transcriptional regulator ligand-binding domain-containing protein [Aliamphritea hakodatensis]
MQTNSASAKLLEPVLQLARHFPQQGERTLHQQLLDSAGLSEAEYSKPGARFAVSCYPSVLQTLAEASGNPLITLSLGEATQPRLLGSIGFLMATATTLEQAYQSLIDYLPLLIEGAVLEMQPTAEGSLLTLELNQNDPRAIEYFLACLVNWPRWLTGRQVPAHAVRLALPEPDNIQPYQQFFAAEVEFGAARHQVLLNSEYLSLGCLDANGEMHQLHREFADSLLSKSNQQGALIAQTRNLIRQQLAEGGSAVRREEVAATLGLSLRTLQRKLGVLGTNFQDLYDQTRRDLCLQLIQRGQLSFGEITFQLGFANQSAFQKAFKRWMGIAPSQYRKQIKPHIPDPLNIDTGPVNDADWVQQDNREDAFRQRLNSLTSFSRELLDIAAIGGISNDLSELARVTGNPIARLAIHLWPAEQAGILIREEHTPEQISYHFADPALQVILCGQLSHDEQQRLHRQFAATLYTDLPPQPQQDAHRLGPVLRHLNRLDDPLPDNRRQTLNLQAAAYAREDKHYAQAARYLQYAVTDASDADQRTDLLLQSTDLHLLSSDIRQAEHCLQAIRKQPDAALLPHYQTRRSLLQARLYQAQNRPENALEVLCQQLKTDHRPLPTAHSEQLNLLLSQLERISRISSRDSRQIETPDDNLQLQLLEHISLLARQLSQPLLAACAIGRMTEHCLQHPGSPLAAFAFSSYAWVASWFCADTQLARSFTSKAMHLADSTHHPVQTGSAALRLNSQVQHWFSPLQEVRQQLTHTLELATSHHQWPTLSEGQLLAAQLDLFSNTPLGELYPQLQQQHQQMLTRQQHTQAAWLEGSALTVIRQLQGTEPPPASLSYQHGWQAVSCCISALLLDQQHLWPDLYRWEARLENELAGYFGVSEALFCTTLMRLIQAGQQQAISRRRQLETEQLISRLELWATQSPDNFNCQLQLLQAEQSRFQPDSQTTVRYYEQALQAADRQQFSFHRALVNERYADFLHHNGQKTLARYCLQEAMHFYRHWQADAKIKQLAQTLELLAK